MHSAVAVGNFPMRLLSGGMVVSRPDSGRRQLPPDSSGLQFPQLHMRFEAGHSQPRLLGNAVRLGGGSFQRHRLHREIDGAGGDALDFLDLILDLHCAVRTVQPFKHPLALHQSLCRTQMTHPPWKKLYMSICSYVNLNTLYSRKT
ncbi:hypothetical protein D3C73_1317330 [compost metagenome]